MVFVERVLATQPELFLLLFVLPTKNFLNFFPCSSLLVELKYSWQNFSQVIIRQAYEFLAALTSMYVCVCSGYECNARKLVWQNCYYWSCLNHVLLEHYNNNDLTIPQSSHATCSQSLSPHYGFSRLSYAWLLRTSFFLYVYKLCPVVASTFYEREQTLKALTSMSSLSDLSTS